MASPFQKHHWRHPWWSKENNKKPTWGAWDLETALALQSIKSFCTIFQPTNRHLCTFHLQLDVPILKWAINERLWKIRQLKFEYWNFIEKRSLLFKIVSVCWIRLKHSRICNTVIEKVMTETTCVSVVYAEIVNSLNETASQKKYKQFNTAQKDKMKAANIFRRLNGYFCNDCSRVMPNTAQFSVTVTKVFILTADKEISEMKPKFHWIKSLIFFNEENIWTLLITTPSVYRIVIEPQIPHFKGWTKQSFVRNTCWVSYEIFELLCGFFWTFIFQSIM